MLQFKAKANVLVADGTQANRKMLQFLLSRRSMDCHLAGDGPKAINMYKLSISAAGAEMARGVGMVGTGAWRPVRYDCMFIDASLPVLDGMQTVATIRQLGFTGLIVGLTANELSDDRASFM